MGTDKFLGQPDGMLGSNPAMGLHPIQGEWQLTPSHFTLQTPGLSTESYGPVGHKRLPFFCKASYLSIDVSQVSFYILIILL